MERSRDWLDQAEWDLTHAKSDAERMPNESSGSVRIFWPRFSREELLVVYRGPPRPDAYKLVWRTLQIPGLEPHVYSKEEYLNLRETIERMCQDGVVLYPSDRTSHE